MTDTEYIFSVSSVLITPVCNEVPYERSDKPLCFKLP